MSTHVSLVGAPKPQDPKECPPKREITGHFITESFPTKGAAYRVANLEYTVDGAYFGQTAEVAGANVQQIAALFNPSNAIFIVCYVTKLEIFANAGGGTPFMELGRIIVAPTGGTLISPLRRVWDDSASRATFMQSPTNDIDRTERYECGFTPPDGQRLVIVRRPPDCPIILKQNEGAMWHTQGDATNLRFAAKFEWFEVSK